MVHIALIDDPVMSCKDDIIAIMFEALTSDSPAMNCAGITGLVTMVTLNDVCSDQQVMIVVTRKYGLQDSHSVNNCTILMTVFMMFCCLGQFVCSTFNKTFSNQKRCGCQVTYLSKLCIILADL